MSETKYCINCVWFRKKFGLDATHGKCAHPRSYKPGDSLVSPEFAEAYASIERWPSKACGPEAKNWEPKPVELPPVRKTFLQRIGLAR